MLVLSKVNFNIGIQKYTTSAIWCCTFLCCQLRNQETFFGRMLRRHFLGVRCYYSPHWECQIILLITNINDTNNKDTNTEKWCQISLPKIKCLLELDDVSWYATVNYNYIILAIKQVFVILLKWNEISFDTTNKIVQWSSSTSITLRPFL